MKPFHINTLLIDERVRDRPLTRHVLGQLPSVRIEVLDGDAAIAARLATMSLTEGKKSLLITQRAGDLVKPCPGTNPPYLCCRYTVINQAWQCPMDCTYCVLQGYLEWPVMALFADTDRVETQIESLLDASPRRFFRFGTGELADSLALDPLTGMAAHWIRFFHGRRNCLIELKTKSDHIEGALSAPSGNAVLAWSVNPPALTAREELHTAPLEARLAAARRAQDAGFLLAFHFDPMVIFPGWEAAYRQTVETLFSYVDPARVVWISLGAMRFPPALGNVMRSRFPGSSILDGEMIRGLDGKMRYIRPLRESMFSSVVEEIRRHDPNLFLYFCMEPPWMWERVLKWSPADNAALDYEFAQSLSRRFPELGQSEPDPADYIE